MATATARASALSAQSILENARTRITELEMAVIDIDHTLKGCSADQVAQLMDARRASDDQRLWLMNKLAEYETAANLEMWEAPRDRLNSQWAPLAERRTAATEKLGECTALLLAAIDDLKAIHDAQRNLLVAFTPTDKLKPKRADSAQRNIQPLDTAYQQSTLWVAQTLKPKLPEGARFTPRELTTDPAAVAFRSTVL